MLGSEFGLKLYLTEKHIKESQCPYVSLCCPPPKEHLYNCTWLSVFLCDSCWLVFNMRPWNLKILSLFLWVYEIAVLCVWAMIEDESSVGFRVDSYLSHIWQWMMSFAEVFYLNCPFVGLYGPPPLPPSPPASGKLDHFWGQQSEESLVLFLPDLWCHPLLRTCMWSSAAGREAHMHFTSPLVIFGSVRSRVYWTIHNLTSHWGLAETGFFSLFCCPLTAISSKHIMSFKSLYHALWLDSDVLFLMF